MCVFSAFDYFLPPVFLWTWIAVAWFLGNSFVSWWIGQRLPVQPRPLVAIVLAIGCLFLGSAMLGPLVLWPLAVPPLIGFVRAVRRKIEGPAARRLVLWVGAAHLAVVVAGVPILVETRRVRTVAGFICRWPGTAVTRSMLFGLVDAEPASLDAYRTIVTLGSSSDRIQAAKRIGAIGDVRLDRELLRSVRREIDASDAELVQEIDAAIAVLDSRRQSEP
jgi:hypothetical protein